MLQAITRPGAMGAGLLLAAAALLPAPARAAWLGLGDGTYTITLSCDSSTILGCPQAWQGTMQVAGSGVTQLGITVGGQAFDGDPADLTSSSPAVDFEGSSYTPLLTPFSFLSLRLTTAGAFGSYGVGDRWWVYCHNTGSGCSPGTFGTWTAEPAGNTVPEPATWALAALGLALASVRRGR